MIKFFLSLLLGFLSLAVDATDADLCSERYDSCYAVCHQMYLNGRDETPCIYACFDSYLACVYAPPVDPSPSDPPPSDPPLDPNLDDAAPTPADADEAKPKGPPPCDQSKGNPINAGSGDKFHEEVIYQSAGARPLHYVLSYTSRKGTDRYKPRQAHGMYWTHNYQRQVYPDGSGTSTNGPGYVGVRLGNGQLVRYTRQATGNYLPDADVAHALVRQTNASGTTTGWLLTHADTGEVESYFSNGKLWRTRDREGRTTILIYDMMGRLRKITDGHGQTLSLTYDANNRIGSLTQPDEGVVVFDYDAANNLSSISWPESTARTFVYENAAYPNNLTGIIDENGVRYATYGYDSQGRAISSEHAGGADRITLTYNGDGTVVTDARGTARTTMLTTVLGVARSTGESQPGGSGCGPAASVQTYDTNGNIATRSDFNGTVTTYTYDLKRNLETQRVEASGTPEARTTSTRWHSLWRLPVKVAEPLKTTTWVYNGDGASCAPAEAVIAIDTGTQPIAVLCRRIEQATLDASGSQGFAASPNGTARTWNYTYNQHGQILTATGPRTDVSELTTYTYYANDDADLGKRGNVATITNALGHVTRISTYDAIGRPLTIIDPNGLTTTLAYDARGRITSRTVGSEITTYQYDGVGQLTTLTLPDSSSLIYTYDAAHRLTSISDDLGNAIAYTLDALGNRIREEVRDGGRQLTRNRTRAYDALNRLAQDIGGQGQVTGYAYDANGNLTGITDPRGQTTAHSYDALNRLVKITDPAGGQTRMSYNGQDRLVQVTDPRNLVTGYTLDGLGHLTQQTSPDTGSTQYSVDSAGNRVSRTDARGQVTATQYDVLNRTTQISYQDGRQERYTWDQGPHAIGRLSRLDEIEGGQITASLQYEYDGQGNVVTETRTLGGVIAITRYRYANGRLTGLTYPSGKKIDYTLDGIGRIYTVTLTHNGQVSAVADAIDYHPFGGIKSWSTSSGQIITRNQDTDGRTTDYSLGSNLWQLGYDAAGRISYQTDTGNAANTVTYGYDNLNRLTSVVLPSTTHGYVYDATGNRTRKTVGGGTTTYTVSPSSNRLTTIASTPPKSLAYDANGSITGDGTNQYSYDSRGRLVQAQTAAGTTSYRVDALGQRVRKTGTTQDTLYHYDRDGHLIAETTPTGVPRREYIWVGDLPVAVLQ